MRASFRRMHVDDLKALELQFWSLQNKAFIEMLALTRKHTLVNTPTNSDISVLRSRRSPASLLSPAPHTA